MSTLKLAQMLGVSGPFCFYTNQETIINISFNIGSNRRDLEAALWWPEAQSEKQDDINLLLIDPNGIERAKSWSGPSIFERAEVSGTLTPGLCIIRIKGYNIQSGPQK